MRPSDQRKNTDALKPAPRFRKITKTESEVLFQTQKSYHLEDIFDELRPQPGVKLINGSRTKAGNSFTGMTSPIEMNMMASGTWDRITKADYDVLTKSTNISKDTTLKGEMLPDLVQDSINPTFGVTEMRSSFSTEMKSLKFGTPIRESKKEDKTPVKVHSAKLLDILLKSGIHGDAPIAESEVKEKFERKNLSSVTANEILRKTPVDSFNLEIMNNRDWGKPNAMYIQAQDPIMFPKSRHKHTASVGGMSTKGVRERMSSTFTSSFYSTKNQSLINEGTSKLIGSKPMSRGMLSRYDRFY